MKKCLIVINSLCGRSSKVDEERLAARFGGAYSPTVLHITDEKDEWSADGFDLVVAAGGDGTFSHALVNCSAAGVPLIYYGAGTFNECAKSKGARRGRKNEAEFVPLGKLANLSGKPFGYVAAAGSFTPLGYTSSPARKKKLGVFAYILNILREYKVYDIPVTVISREYSTEWKDGMEPYYPVNDARNAALYAHYRELAARERRVIFGGRLGMYRYFDMDDTIAAAWQTARELGIN